MLLPSVTVILTTLGSSNAAREGWEAANKSQTRGRHNNDHLPGHSKKKARAENEIKNAGNLLARNVPVLAGLSVWRDKIWREIFPLQP